MYIKAEITVVDGQTTRLANLISEYLSPILREAGWHLATSMQAQETPNHVTNIWDVGTSPDAGFAHLRAHKDYDHVKTEMSQCILKETLTYMDDWLS